MNREIKYRGKRHNGEWVYGSVAYSSNSVVAIRYEIDTGAVRRFDWCYVDPDTVGQFTGLYDENGKEIYEGDIIEATSILGGSIGRKMKCSVDYYNDYACFIFVASDRRRFICTSISDIVVEVIGNIYDNPELLKN